MFDLHPEYVEVRPRWTPRNHALEPGQHGPKFSPRQLWVLENINGLPNRDRERAIDIAWGFYLGFPVCCIEFYVYTWIPRYDSSPLGSWVADHTERMREVDPSRSIGRILCPKCIRLIGKQAQQWAKVGRMDAPLSASGVGGGVHTRQNPRSSNLGRSKRAGLSRERPGMAGVSNAIPSVTKPGQPYRTKTE
jgi:hypothetical protein